MNCSFAGMNYLGHAYLSFDSPQILVGNMISDFVKGSSRLGFSGNIQKGISLHRLIDDYTDSHPATKKAMEVFRPHYRLYAAPIMDILFDHFLANDPNLFNAESLKTFANATYLLLEKNMVHLPGRFVHVFTYMRAEDWLYNYRFKESMGKSLYGLVRRSSFLKESDTAYRLFNDHYDHLNDCYRQFFPDVKRFAKQQFDQLI